MGFLISHIKAYKLFTNSSINTICNKELQIFITNPLTKKVQKLKLNIKIESITYRDASGGLRI